MDYTITRDFIKHGKSRSGTKIDKIRFIVAHDTGNPGSTAHGNRNYFNNQQPSASAHTFIDDKYILEIIPLTEKAWHVQYQKPIDNQMFGDDANDCAIGVELCWGPGINFDEAYKRYVWYHVYLCKTFGLVPDKHIVSHKTLDPERKTDPDNALNRHGITWKQFLNDVISAFEGPKAPKDTTKYRLRSGAFANAADFAKAVGIVKGKGWLVYEKADSLELNTTYRFLTGTFEGRELADKMAAELKPYGWLIYVDKA